MRTIKVIHDKGYMVINAGDFNPTVHEKYPPPKSVNTRVSRSKSSSTSKKSDLGKVDTIDSNLIKD